MSRFGKSFKNRFLAIALAGAMVMSSVASSGMPVFAAETSEAESAEDVTSWDETKDVSEEAAEENEVKQKDSEENETEQQESEKPETESGTTAKLEESTTAKEDVDTEDEETKELETDTEETDTEQTAEEVENKAAISDATFADGHTKASWGVDNTSLNLEKAVGTYTNAENDVLFIDASAGKFAYSTDNNGRYQVNRDTKIYVPVIGNKAKITIKLSYVGTVDNLFSEYLSVTGIDGKLAETDKKCTKVTGSYGNTVIECELGYGSDETGAVCLEILQNNYLKGITVACGDDAVDEYESTEGNAEKYIMFSQEGYASSYGTNGVTGGGLLKKGVSENYYEVDTAEKFLDALVKIKSSGEKSVIEITKDMKLGSKEVDVSKYNVISKNAEEPLKHPTLLTTGVSDLTLEKFSDLTIFSSNGSSILHCNIILKKSSNIIFRNIKFDELWEWDEGGTNQKNEYCKPGDYDRNDWDYLCIDQDCDGIWIDHCTFYKAYDGIIDVKNPADNGKQRVTISWCEFLPGSEDNTFFDEQMTWLENHASETNYYRMLISKNKDDTYTYTDKDGKTQTIKAGGFTDAQVRMYAYGQKKTHLFGQDDDKKNAVGIRVTLANNHYNNSMDRMPRLRYGKVHEYNCIMDATEIYAAKKDMGATGHIVSNGASSTCGGEILLENCYIKDIINALNSGNGSSPIGYINAINSKYIIDGAETTLKPTNNTTHATDKNKDPLITDEDAFREALPYYGYTTYNADTLDTKVKPNAGAGKPSLSEVQWEKTSYGVRSDYGTRDEGDSAEEEVGDDFSLSANDLASGDITSDKNIPGTGFTIKATSSAKVTVDTNNKTIEGTSFTQRIKLNGTGSETSQSIHFHAGKAGTLTVYAMSGSSNEDRNLGLYKVSDTTAIDTQTASGTSPSILKYDITESGDYYIRSANSGINIYFIAFAAKNTEDEETEGSSGTEESSSSEESSKAEESSSSEESSEAEESSSSEESSKTEESSSSEESSEAEESSSSEESSEAEESSSSEESSEAEESSSSEESSETEGSTDDGKYKTETLKFRATNLEAKKLTDDLKVDDYFTVKIGSEIESKSETQIAGEKLTNRVKFSGAGSNESMSIQIKSLGEGTLKVYAVSGSTSTERTLKLLDSEGKTVNGAEANIKEAAAVTIQVPGKGIYYLASKSGGINVYGIDFEVTYKEGETLPEEPKDPSLDPPTYTTPDGGERYGADEGKESNYVKYNMEGYAASANVTGGGLLKDEGNEGYYYKVSNEKQFLEALSAIRTVKDKPHVIEITTDLNLGYKEVNTKYNLNIQGASGGDYSGVIRAYDGDNNKPLMHPTLDKTGVSYIKLHDFHNLTIFSQNGATIKHAGMMIEGSSENIIIRNLVFDELWEWDDIADKDGKYGSYDRNNWDYIAIQDSAEGIWIDHCTFYKAYDGVIDIKEGKKGYQRVTISWCEFLPGSENNTFFNEQMKWLEDNIEDTTYYKQLRQTENMSKEDVWWYAYGQKKTHLFGDDDKNVQDKAIRATLANNYYKNSMDRMPRLRYGIAHEYNCILDAQNLYTKKHSGNSGLSSHITNQGAISTCGGQMLLENCYIRGIESPLYSGNGSSPTGYNKAIGSVHYKDGKLVKAGTLEPIKSGSGSGTVLTTNEAEFKAALPYSDYITYDATQLYTKVMPYAGAGKVSMSTVQWERTNYGDRTGNESSSTSTAPNDEPKIPNDELPKTPWDETENPDNPDDPPAETIAPLTATPADGTQFPSGGGTITLDCETNGVTIYYTTSSTESGLTDPADANNTSRVEYTAPIELKEETYIWAVAVKDGKTSEPLKCHYTVLAEGSVVKPTANPGSEAQPTEVQSGTKVALNVTDDTIEKIYYTMGSTPDDTADPREENSGRYTYSDEITITEAITIKAVAQKGDKYSDVATFTYTIKADVNPDPDKTVAAPTFSKAEGTVEKGEKITIACATEGANIYYTTDGSEPKAEEQFLYTTEISIDKTMTIRAIAVKDGVSSTESIVTYTVMQTEKPNVSDDLEDPGTEDPNRKGIWITGLKDTYDYTGAKIMPDIKVWDCDLMGNARLLSPGIDYTVAYKNNTKPADEKTELKKMPTVTVTGKGNYSGKNVTETFMIKYAAEVTSPIDVKGAKVELVEKKYAPVYDGTPKNPAFKLVFKGRTPVTYEYEYDSAKGQYVRKDKEPMNVNVAVSNNVNKGTATILVTGMADAKGRVSSAKAAFKITPVDLSQQVTITATSGVYAVNGAVPETLTVKWNGKDLVKGIDYTVKYSGNKKVGTQGTVTVIGKGNFTKNQKAKYDISPLDMSNLSVRAVTAYENITPGKIKATVADDAGNVLKPAQYKLNIYAADKTTLYGAKDRTKLAAKTVIYVEATLPDRPKDNNLTGKTEKVEFTVGKDISKAKFELQKGLAKEYTGEEIKLESNDFRSITYKDRSGTSNLRMGEHFEIVSYSNNINKGTATAVIKGVNDYSGTKTIKFKITQKKMIQGK